MLLGWQVSLEEHHHGNGLPVRWNSKTDHQLLQPNGLRTKSTGMDFCIYPTLTSLSTNLFSGQNLVEGSQAELQPPSHYRICYRGRSKLAAIIVLFYCPVKSDAILLFLI